MRAAISVACIVTRPLTTYSEVIAVIGPTPSSTPARIFTIAAAAERTSAKAPDCASVSPRRYTSARGICRGAAETRSAGILRLPRIADDARLPARLGDDRYG